MILLTGASGFLGNRILANLINTNANIRCLSRKYMPNYKNVNWVKLNLLESTFPDDLLNGCSHIIHCAGAIKGSKAALKQVNYISTLKLLELARKENVKKFVFISSIDSILSDSVYAHTKKIAEKAVATSGINWIIIRPSQVFGLSDNKNFHLLNKLVKKLPVIPIPSGGRFKWEPVFVDDLARYIAEITLNNNISNQAFDVVGPEAINFYEIICILEEFNNVKKAKISIPPYSMNLLKNFTAAVLGKHMSDQIFSTFVDKIVPENGESKKVKLSTKFSEVFKNT